MSLRLRITLLLAIISLGVGALAAIGSYLDTESQLHTGIDDTMRSRAIEVNSVDKGANSRGGAGGRSGPGNDSADCPPAGLFQPASAAQLVSLNGTVTPCIAGGPTLPVTNSEPPKGVIEVHTVSIDGIRYRMLTTTWHDGGTLQIARGLGESNALLARLRIRLAALVASATVLAAALGWAVAARLARPITRLRDTTHQIASTLDLSTPIDATGPLEVESLALSFSSLVSAVARSQEQQRRLVSDASHEMRTPLTSLRSNVELLRKIEQLPQPDRLEVVADVLDDIDDLSLLLGELVDLASDLAAAEALETVRLGDLARAVASRTNRRAERNVTIEETMAIDVIGRPRQLERAISNLVDNAVKYSAPSTTVEIVVDGPTVQVRDRGRGFHDADLVRVFDRFYRAVDARTESGSGLGLSIVDEIVRSHAGRVFARNREGGGAVVGFTLPC